ncbi:hypothetical protein YC2023_050748 [Brassica napus]
MKAMKSESKEVFTSSSLLKRDYLLQNDFPGAHRPPVVSPRGRSRLRERPQWVALRGRSGSIVLSSRDRNASDLGVSLWPSHSGLRERPGVVALIGRSGSVFGFHRDEMASDFSASLCEQGSYQHNDRVAQKEQIHIIEPMPSWPLLSEIKNVKI